MMFNQNSISDIIVISMSISLITFLLMKLLPKYCGIIFGQCISNEKTSKYHLPLIRGLGIIFPFILICSHFFLGSIFSLLEITIIAISTIVGLWDDKIGLGHKAKLKIFLTLALIFSLSITDYDNIQNYLFLKYLLNIFIFIFLILFFNQIDGINGLASSTFLIILLFLVLNGINIFLFLPIALAVFTYLIINMKGNLGIQGDAGSFFMGSFIAVLLTKSFYYIEYGFIFFLISPVLFDISATTLIKIYYKVDLTIGHRDNLYQKLVSQLQNHYSVTILFSVLQFIFCLLLIFLLNNYVIEYVYLCLILIGVCLAFIFCRLAYLIHNKKIFK